MTAFSLNERSLRNSQARRREVACCHLIGYVVQAVPEIEKECRRGSVGEIGWVTIKNLDSLHFFNK